MPSQETRLTPVNDVLNKSLVHAGMNYRVMFGALAVMLVFLLAGVFSRSLKVAVLGVAVLAVLSAAGMYFGRKDPRYLQIKLISLFQYGYYDPAKETGRAEDLLRRFRLTRLVLKHND